MTTSTSIPATWLKPDELAAQLRVTVQHLASMRFEGRGPRFHKIGAAVRYRQSDVDLWLVGQAREHSGNGVSR